MRRRERLIAGICAILAALLVPSSGAQEPTPIDIVRNADLGFGSLVAGAASGSITVTPAGARSAAGGVTLGNGAAVSAGAFTVSGEPNQSYAITLSGSATLADGAESMIADAFTSSPEAAGTLGPAGAQEVTVGATLHVGPNQPRGAYSGSFNVTVSYN